jgi:hypothetical protein
VQNARSPAPLSTPTRTSGSRLNSVSTSRQRRRIAASSALSRCGRFSVIRAMWFSTE